MTIRSARVVLLFACLAALLVQWASLRAADSINWPKVVLVRQISAEAGVDLTSRLRIAGADILETYQGFALVSLRPGARGDLERAGFVVDDLPDRGMIRRGSYSFDTRAGEPPLPESLRIDPRREQDYDVYIVQFIGPVKAEWLDALRAAGGEAFAYLPNFSYVVTLEHRAVARVERLRFVRWIGVYQPAYKIGADLLRADDEPMVISFALFPGRDPMRAEEVVSASGGEMLDAWTINGQHLFRATVSRSAMIDLARLKEVAAIGRFAPASFANDLATWVTQTDISNNRSIHGHGLHGEGQLVTLTDEGVYPSHPMFLDTNPIGPTHRKIQSCTAVPDCAVSVPCNNDPNPDPNLHLDGHGTRNAGTIAGDAPDAMSQYGTYNDHDGHAFMARLVVQDIGGEAACITGDVIGNLFQPSFNQGSRIHNNSWGTSGGTTYCVGAVGSDQFMWDNPDYLVIFAAGNEGLSGVRCEAGAKDVITVGASLNGTQANDRLVDSSRGPAGTDGRRKPTLMAPGGSICSATRPNASLGGPCTTNPINSSYASASGTSYAAPAATGNAVLVRQYFTEGWYPTGAKTAANSMTPSAALMKADLINGADEMTGNTAYSGSTLMAIEGPSHSAPYALDAKKAQNSIDPALATSVSIGLDYNQPYDLDLYFLIPTSVPMGQLTVANDGRFKVLVTPSGSSAVSFNVNGNIPPGNPTAGRGSWHHLFATYTPTLGTVQVTLDNFTNLGSYGFYSSPLDKLSVGEEAAGGSYGELDVDDICYRQPSGTDFWCDSFDSTDLTPNWSLVPRYDDTGYPNYIQGWGRINLENSLFFAGDARSLLACDDRAGLRTGEVRSTKVQVTNTAQPLEVTLVWSDRPGTLNQEHALVNNLDLAVTAPGGSPIYRGNCFQGKNPAQSVSTTTAPNCLADAVNVEEDVLRLVPTPANGIWTIDVTAQSVDPSGGDMPQPFALVVTGGVVSPAPDVTVVTYSDYLTNPGTRLGAHDYTHASDDVTEGLQESSSGGAYHLTQIWKLINVPCRSSYNLHLEGSRSSGGGKDSFQFAWAPEVNGAPGTFQNITNAIISKPFEVQGGTDYPFVAPGLSGTIYIRATDMSVGANQTTLSVDYLTVR